MSLDLNALTRASQSIRGYEVSDDPDKLEEAHAAVLDLIAAARAQSDGQSEAALREAALREALQLLRLGTRGANRADSIIDGLLHAPR